MEYTGAELCKKLCISLTQLTRLRKSGKLQGYKEKKIGRKVLYVQDIVKELELSAEAITRKKLELTESQIQKNLQQIEKKKDEIRKEYRNEILDELMILLKSHKKALTEAKLTDEQANYLTNSLTETMENLLKLKEI